MMRLIPITVHASLERAFQRAAIRNALAYRVKSFLRCNISHENQLKKV
jgi:hypothetical protein